MQFIPPTSSRSAQRGHRSSGFFTASTGTELPFAEPDTVMTVATLKGWTLGNSHKDAKHSAVVSLIQPRHRKPDQSSGQGHEGLCLAVWPLVLNWRKAVQAEYMVCSLRSSAQLRSAHLRAHQRSPLFFWHCRPCSTGMLKPLVAVDCRNHVVYISTKVTYVCLSCFHIRRTPAGRGIHEALPLRSDSHSLTRTHTHTHT